MMKRENPDLATNGTATWVADDSHAYPKAIVAHRADKMGSRDSLGERLSRNYRVVRRFKTIPGWLRTSLVVIVISRSCCRRM